MFTMVCDVCVSSTVHYRDLLIYFLQRTQKRCPSSLPVKGVIWYVFCQLIFWIVTYFFSNCVEYRVMFVCVKSKAHSRDSGNVLVLSEQMPSPYNVMNNHHEGPTILWIRHIVNISCSCDLCYEGHFIHYQYLVSIAHQWITSRPVGFISQHLTCCTIMKQDILLVYYIIHQSACSFIFVVQIKEISLSVKFQRNTSRCKHMKLKLENRCLMMH